MVLHFFRVHVLAVPPQRFAFRLIFLHLFVFVSLYVDRVFVLNCFIWFYGSLKRQSNESNVSVSKFLFLVFAGAEVGTVLTSVTANDVDTYPALKYSLIQGDNRFSIDRYSGKVVLNRPLDFEIKKLYEVNITASDSEHVAKTTLTIKVTDVNDNSPVFDDISYNKILPGTIQLILLLSSKNDKVIINSDRIPLIQLG